MPEILRQSPRPLAVYALLILLGGCVHQHAVAPETKAAATPQSAPPTTPPSTNTPAVESPPPSAAAASSNVANSSALPPNDAAAMPAASPTPTQQGLPPAAAVSSSKPGPPTPVAKTVPPASSKASPPARAVAPAPPATATPPIAPTAQPAAALDLASLEQRLRETHAIGVFTKLSLKNQVDDLLAQFKSFHQGQTPPTLSQLRQRYELLLIKVISALQDGDAALAAAVSSSREALWSILSDPQKFAQI